MVNKIVKYENCPLCGAPASKQYIQSETVYSGREEQKILRCKDCDVAYLFPMPSDEDKDDFYKNEFQSFMEKRTSSSNTSWLDPERHVADNQTQVTRRMKYIEPRLPAGGGRILDIGCASGFMLLYLNNLGYDCIGVEPSDEFRNFIISQGMTCFASMDELLESSEGDLGFDLILHFFVLDEIRDPVTFLKTQLQILRKSGNIIFEVNSTDDALITLFGLENFSKFYWQVAESYFFSLKSFQYLLEKLNEPFEVLLDQRYDLSNHLTWAIDGKPGGMGRFTHIIGSELEEQYKKALIGAQKCDTLIGIVKKT